MSKQAFAANALTGGTSGALDDILHTILEDGNLAIVVDATSNNTYLYTYDSSSASAESSPDVIIPDSNSTGSGAWILTSLVCDDLTFSGTANDGSNDLTATFAEINSVCDANTATAAEITSVCDGNTATAAEIVKAADGIGTIGGQPRQKIIEIGDWNMDIDPAVSVAHGETIGKVIHARVTIRSDAGALHPFHYEARS